jgi:hypothetical protein
MAVVLALSAATVLCSTAHGQALKASVVSRVSYVRDRFGGLRGAYVAIQLPAAKRTYTLSLSKSFLDLPLATQVARLDQQFRLGEDAAAVRQALQGIQQSLRDESIRRQQKLLQPQPPITIPQPPVPQPPIVIPQLPNQPPIPIPRPPMPQPPITVPR